MHKKKQREPLRRAKKALQRKEDAKDGELKNNPEEIKKARARPISAASKKVLRENEDNNTPTPGFSDFVRKKHADSSGLSRLPTDEEGARRYATKNLRPKPRPNQFWLEQQ